MRKVLRPGDTFIDVGANVGLYTKLGAELVGPKGYVHAIEPDPRNCDEVKKLVDEFPQVALCSKPCWDRITDKMFYECEQDTGASALWDVTRYDGNKVGDLYVLKTTTLRHEIEAIQRSPTLIKIDAEGADQRVIEGMLPATVPLIIAELNAFGLRQCGCSVESFLRCVRDIGYHVYVMHLDGSGAQLLQPGQTISSPYIHNVLLSMRECVDRMLWP